VSAALATPVLGWAVPAADASPAPTPAVDPSHRVVHRDAQHDVLIWDLEGDSTSPDPTNTTSDIVRTIVNHGARRLSLTAELQHLGRGQYRMLLSEIHASDGVNYLLTVDYARTPIGARLTLERASGKPVACPGATWSVDAAADTVATSVPRSCLHDPDWVRVGVGSVSAPSDLSVSRADDSRRNGTLNPDHVRVGPRQPHA
jgi:hypothetical protein